MSAEALAGERGEVLGEPGLRDEFDRPLQQVVGEHGFVVDAQPLDDGQLTLIQVGPFQYRSGSNCGESVGTLGTANRGQKPGPCNRAMSCFACDAVV